MEQMPNWARAQDMRGLLEDIEKREFTALSSGIGLGKARRAIGRQTVDAPSHAGAPAQQQMPLRPKAQSSSHWVAVETSTKQHASVESATRRRAAVGVGRRLQAYFLDFLLVLATCALAVIGLTAYDLHEAPGSRWLDQPAVQWLAHTNPLVTLALIYAVFLAYGLLFKLMVGNTCGESLLGISAKSLTAMGGAKQIKG